MKYIYFLAALAGMMCLGSCSAEERVEPEQKLAQEESQVPQSRAAEGDLSEAPYAPQQTIALGEQERGE